MIFYIENGVIMCASLNMVIDRPALIIDFDLSVVLGYGDAEAMSAKYSVMCSRALQQRSPLVNSIAYIELDSAVHTVEQQCYILRRCAEISASKFPGDLVRHFTKDDYIEWLNREMTRVPLETVKS